MKPSRMYFEIDFAAGTSVYTPVHQRRYVWRIRSAGNHQILSSSEVLNSHAACTNAINIVYQDAGDSLLHDKTKTS
jgi:uncharacterized protein YegP (UPF0339 family)